MGPWGSPLTLNPETQKPFNQKPLNPLWEFWAHGGLTGILL